MKYKQMKKKEKKEEEGEEAKSKKKQREAAQDKNKKKKKKKMMKSENITMIELLWKLIHPMCGFMVRFLHLLLKTYQKYTSKNPKTLSLILEATVLAVIEIFTF